ncbi:MAG TPA: hypothetical protein VK756_06645 [Solirubrobacteraceae bacterium]|jgi:hypothetical protein|nr:hypothetical protein [Solirubrobacteraceae bacterium]
MSYVKVTLAAGIVLVILIGAFTLTRSPPRVVRGGGPPPISSLGTTFAEPAVCQANEVLPADVSSIRLSLVAFFGANIRLVLYHGSQIIAEGRRGPDWTGTTVTVPVKPIARTTSHVTLCVAIGPNSERIIILGRFTHPRDVAVALQSNALSATPPATATAPQRLKGRMAVEYLASSNRSWWSRAVEVARRMGLGHFIGGKWIALLAALLMTAVGALTIRVTLREQP